MGESKRVNDNAKLTAKKLGITEDKQKVKLFGIHSGTSTG